MIATSGRTTMRRNPSLAVLLALLVPSAAAWSAESAKRVQFLNPPGAEKSGYPFSQAVRAGDTLWLSGQIGLDPATGKLVEGGIVPETKQTMQNIVAALETHGYSLRDVVKCTVMLADIAEWARFNEVYRTFFDGAFPARSALGASGLALGARVEVECIAYVGK